MISLTVRYLPLMVACLDFLLSILLNIPLLLLSSTTYTSYNVFSYLPNGRVITHNDKLVENRWISRDQCIFFSFLARNY